MISEVSRQRVHISFGARKSKLSFQRKVRNFWLYMWLYFRFFTKEFCHWFFSS